MSNLLKFTSFVLLVTGSLLEAVPVEHQKPKGLGARDLIGGLIDHLTCVRTTNRGYKGRCVARACCTRSLGVDELCTDPEYTCCYGGDSCTGNDFNNEIVHPPHHVHHEGHHPDIIDNHHSVDAYDRRCIRQLVRRYEWNAAETRGRVRHLPSGLRHVIIHHTDDGERPCWSFEECRRYLQRVQHNYQHRKDFPDIPWNFIIGENGEVFEGMGWGLEGYHTEGWNERSVAIAFIGDFDVQSPTKRSLVALDQLLHCGMESGYIDRYFGLYGHRDMRDTECPGDFLYEEIRHMKAFQKFGKRSLEGQTVFNSTNAASH